jgi:hypothetical protein
MQRSGHDTDIAWDIAIESRSRGRFLTATRDRGDFLTRALSRRPNHVVGLAKRFAGGPTHDSLTAIAISCVRDQRRRRQERRLRRVRDGLATVEPSGNCSPSAGSSIASVMAGICEAMQVPHPYGAVMPGLKKA